MSPKVLPFDVLFFLLFLLLVPFLLGDSYFFETVNIIGIYGIAIIGLNFILGLTGLISLGHAAFFGLGAYISAWLSMHLQLPAFLTVLMSCAAVALFSFLISYPLLRLSGYFLVLGTLGVGVIVHTLINGGGKITGGPNGLSGIPGFAVGSFQFDSFTKNFYLIWITLFVVYLLTKKVLRTREGWKTCPLPGNNLSPT